MIRTTSDLPDQAGLVIIGGGIVGAASAFFAARAGLHPLILENRSALATLTTPASTGAFRLQFDNQAELEMIRESVDIFLNFAEFTDQKEYRAGIIQQGYLWVTTREARAEYQRELVARQHSWGQTDIELLDGDEVRSRFPYVSPAVIQGRFRAGDGFLDPKSVALGFAHGADCPVVINTRADKILVANDRVIGVETTRGVIDTDLVLIAAGPFSGQMAGTAGIQLPLDAVNRNKVVMPRVPEVPTTAPMTIDDDTGTHWRPALEGAYLLFTDPAVPPSEPSWSPEPDHDYALRILDPDSPQAAARISPFWSDVWRRSDALWLVQAGQYSVTPDHRPLIGETDVNGLFINSGYSGHGIMAGPAGSRHLIDTIVHPGRANPFALDRHFEATTPGFL